MTTTPEMKPCCENCRFYDDGLCRRYPPQLGTGIDSDSNDEGIYRVSGWSSTQWPTVDADDWCGEHEAKGAEDE